MTTEELVKSRYERDVIAGRIVTHHGDCSIYRVRICTCGLLDLLAYDPENANKIYSKFTEQHGEQDYRIQHLQENPPPPMPEMTPERQAEIDKLFKEIFFPEK
jgi:hypothetical protein